MAAKRGSIASLRAADIVSPPTVLTISRRIVNGRAVSSDKSVEKRVGDTLDGSVAFAAFLSV